MRLFKKKLVPKYSVGQKLFYIENSKVASNVITGVHVGRASRYDSGPSIRYSLSDEFTQYNWEPESSLFASKEELLENL